MSTKAMKKIGMVVLLIAGNYLLGACSSVNPWERGFLAKPEMAWTPDSLRWQLQEHIYFSKEGSSGGYGAGGGGCGCN